MRGVGELIEESKGFYRVRFGQRLQIVYQCQWVTADIENFIKAFN